MPTPRQPSRDQPLPRPEFATEAEAAAAGYLIRLPHTEEYRGWLILTDYKNHRIRVFGREISGTWAEDDTPKPVLAVGMTGRVRMSRTMPSGRYMKFRWVWLPCGSQPREHVIRIVGRRNRIGVLLELVNYAHQTEWDRAAAELRRLIDIRVDGRENIDLIED